MRPTYGISISQNTNRRPPIIYQFLVYLFNDFICLSTGPATSLFIFKVCYRCLTFPSIIVGQNTRHISRCIQTAEDIFAYKNEITNARQNWREKLLSWILRSAFSNRQTPTESKQLDDFINSMNMLHITYQVTLFVF